MIFAQQAVFSFHDFHENSNNSPSLTFHKNSLAVYLIANIGQTDGENFYAFLKDICRVLLSISSLKILTPFIFAGVHTVWIFSQYIKINAKTVTTLLPISMRLRMCGKWG